ncbi:MAG: peptidoglycan-binding domain-containing protein [Gammaproteobacteria bacterium]|nr:peptidoglycan-binding domain-containing protein [Gammaproteobacteria bacterium]
MTLSNRMRQGALVAVVAAFTAGCASTGSSNSDLEARIAKLQQENEALRDAVVATSAQGGSAPASSSNGTADLPPNAKAGECYARVLEPAVYETRTETITVREASERVELTDPVYEWVEKEVVVKEAWEEVVEVTPAEYGSVEETVIVKEATEKLEIVEAVYEDQTEEVLVKPAYTTWKQGRGPIERIDHATGEIMCLVEIPAEYKTVTRTVLVTPETTTRTVIPAETEVVTRRVMTKAPEVKRVTHPAETKIIKVKQLVKGPEEVRIPVPAETKTITQEYKVSDGELRWRTVLCETNITGDVVKQLQAALKREGYDPVWIDGVYGDKTRQAVTQYQKDNGMASGGLTFETLDKLGVEYRRAI